MGQGHDPPAASDRFCCSGHRPGVAPLAVVGGFHHLPAGPWADLDHELDADVMVCGDDREATGEVVALIDRLPGLRGVDSGGLASALAIEALTPALLEVNRRYKTHAAVQLTGLPPRARVDKTDQLYASLRHRPPAASCPSSPDPR